MNGIIIVMVGTAGVWGWIKFLQADDRANMWEDKYWDLRQRTSKRRGYEPPHIHRHQTYNPNPKFPTRYQFPFND